MLLLPTLQIAFPAADHNIHIRAQQRTSSEIVERRADCGKEYGHQEPLSAVQIPSAINNTSSVRTMPSVTYPKSTVIPPFHLFLPPRSLALPRILQRLLDLRTLIVQKQSKLLPLAL